MEKEGRRFVEKGKERTVGRGGKKRRKCRPWGRSSVATVILKVSKGRLKKKKTRGERETWTMQLDDRCRCKCKPTCNRRDTLAVSSIARPCVLEINRYLDPFR